MPVEAVLIFRPTIDFATLLNLTYQVLSRNIAGIADANHRKMADAEKFLSCLAAFKDQSAKVTSNLLFHASFSVLLIADERDLLDILNMTLGMPFVRAETTTPGVNLAVLTGTLAQWKNAVAAGACAVAPPAVRLCYSKIFLLFDCAGLTSIWDDFDRRSDHNGFLLKRRRG